MLKFAFFLGVIFITFNWLWSIFTGLLRLFTGETGTTEKYILRITQAYFLASMTALATLHYGETHDASDAFLIGTGIVTLFLYLLSKIEQRKKMIQFRVQFNKDKIQFSKSSLKYDLLIAWLTVIFYVSSLFYLPMIQNVMNNWFYNTIQNIYDTPIIGWIIGFIGVFFIFSIFLKGFVAIQLIFDQLVRGFKKDDDDFVDYEEVVDETHKYIDNQ